MDRTITLRSYGRSYKMVYGDDWTSGKIARFMGRGKPYEFPLLDRIYRERFSGVALDVGAHVGNHALWMAAICGLTVVAFEPLRFKDLSGNVRLNDLEDKVTVHPVALGRSSGFVHHAGKLQMVPTANTDEIPVRTLDSFQLRNVSVMKVDVEGMEPDVFSGGLETIQRNLPVIYAEEWDKPAHDAIADILVPAGYRFTSRLDGKLASTPVSRWDPIRGGN